MKASHSHFMVVDIGYPSVTFDVVGYHSRKNLQEAIEGIPSTSACGYRGVPLPAMTSINHHIRAVTC